MRLVEIRLLDGPNVYRLEPTVRIEVAVGRRRSWYGQRQPGSYDVVRLGAPIARHAAPPPVGALAGWVERLEREALGQRTRVSIHRTSEPGRYVVAFAWRAAEKAELVAQAAFRLAEGASERLLARAVERIRAAGDTPPAWISDLELRAMGSRARLISISGTNGKSTTTRMITHIARLAGLHVGTTTTDGVLIAEQMVEPGDFSGPQGARTVLRNPEVDVAVLETARGGILLRGLGYESNDVGVLTNVSADHLDLQGLHTLPELAEVKSVVCRITKAAGAVVLNADDPLVAAVARRVRARVVFFSLDPRSARVRRHIARGGIAYVLENGQLVERAGKAHLAIVAAADIPATVGGLARHNIANALAAAAAARGLGLSVEQVARGLSDVRNTSELLPGRLNLYVNGQRLVMIDYAHNEAGLGALLDTAEALIGTRGRRQASLSLVVGTGGDRPDDSLRAMGRMAAARADEVSIQVDRTYMRGRSEESLVGELKAGMKSAGTSAKSVIVYDDPPSALTGELTTPGRLAATQASQQSVLVMMCHAHREEVFRRLTEAGFEPVEQLAALEPFRAT